MNDAARFLKNVGPENIFCATTQFGLEEDDLSATSDLQLLLMSSNLRLVPKFVCAKKFLSQHVEHGSAYRIVPGVGDHSGTKTLAPPRQQSEHETVDPDE